ncbi:hypothetical protein STEG23_015805 [Scotinomys teguina]
MGEKEEEEEGRGEEIGRRECIRKAQNKGSGKCREPPLHLDQSALTKRPLPDVMPVPDGQNFGYKRFHLGPLGVTEALLQIIRYQLPPPDNPMLRVGRISLQMTWVFAHNRRSKYELEIYFDYLDETDLLKGYRMAQNNQRRPENQSQEDPKKKDPKDPCHRNGVTVHVVLLQSK